jgi:ATP-binding cassette subfamily B multidrug efflux pump
MSMQEEVIVKGYDPEIMARLFKFLKPYWFIVLLAVISLVVATVSELYLPVLLQRTIDEHIISDFYPLDKAALEEDFLFRNLQNRPQTDDTVYVLNQDLRDLAEAEKEALRDGGLLGESALILIPVDQELPQAMSPSDFQRDGALLLLAKSDFELLTPDEKRVLRANDIQGVLRNSMYYFIFQIVVLLFSFFQVYLMAIAGQRVMRDIRQKLMKHVLQRSLSFLQKRPVGTLVSRLTGDVETINELFTSVAISFLRDISIMAGVIITLLLLDTRLALITVLTLPPVLIATLYFRVKARDAYRSMRKWVSQVNAFLSEHIAGMSVVQIFNREEPVESEFKEKNNRLLKASLSEMMVFATFRPIINLLTSISVGVILYFGAGFNLSGALSLGVLIAFLNLIQKFYQPVMDLSEKFTILQSAMAGGERIFDLLDQDDHIPNNGNELISKEPFKVEFDQVDFSYVEDEQVLHKLNLEIEPGSIVAVVGYTGAGKTTISNILTRLWDIDSGAIRINGKDLKDYDLHELRTAVLPVQQDVFIFSGTVLENISLGKDLSREEIMEAAKLVQAHDFIEALPNGYETELNEGGSNLSMGQRQLLSFARVVAHDPQFLILDEATGSVDTETEKKIQEALKILFEGRTSLVIAHRLSTIRYADRILVMEAGRVVEDGSHEDLIQSGGLYAKLYHLQYEAQGAL